MVHLLILRYRASDQEVEPHVPGHVRFLERYHADGVFLASGQTVPVEQGGAIIACGVDRSRIEEIAAEDPFVKAGVASYQITTIEVGRAHPVFADLVRSPLVS